MLLATALGPSPPPDPRTRVQVMPIVKLPMIFADLLAGESVFIAANILI